MKKLVLALSVIAFTACNNTPKEEKAKESLYPETEETVAPAETGNEAVITPPAPARIPSRGSTI